MIRLALDTGSLTLDVDSEAVCVRHRAYDAPRTGPGCRHLTWEEFLAARPLDALQGRKVLVVVGLSRILTPSNRVKVGQLLLRPIDGVRRVVVDRTLFVSEPWRAFWMFRSVGVPYQGFTDSFLAETRWRAAQDGFRAEDPFSLDALVDAGRGVVVSEYERFFDPFEVERVALGAEVHAAYLELKARAFEEEHTSAAIVTRLAAFAAEHCPRRKLPTSARLFEARAHRLVQTDLRVDDWLVGRLRALVDLTDGLGRAFHGAV